RPDHTGNHNVRPHPHEVAAGRGHVGQGAGVGDRSGSGETGTVVYTHEGGLARLLWHDQVADGLFSPGSPGPRRPPPLSNDG
ncbi:MAG: hypothetical protein ACK56I_14125, partial [bacterium]